MIRQNFPSPAANESASSVPSARELVSANLTAQIKALARDIKRDWMWPSAEAGFALYVWSASGENSPLPTTLEGINSADSFAPTGHWEHASVLATAGFAAASGRFPSSLSDMWKGGFDRLRQRDPFPLDREAFPYRPLELLGVALGVAHVSGVSEEACSWLREVLEKAEVTTNTPSSPQVWRHLLGALAASQLGVNWQPPHSSQDALELRELALALWLQNSPPPLPTLVPMQWGDTLSLENRLLSASASQPSAASDLASNATLLLALQRLYNRAISQVSAKTSPRRAAKSRFTHIEDNLRGQIDFAIISVREDEYSAVLKRFTKGLFYEGQHRSYIVHRMPLANEQSYAIATVRCPEQGGAAGQQVTNDIIADLAPHWIMLVGIAGGVPASEFTLGDVVAAMRLQDFSVQARYEGGTTQYATGGGPMHRQVQDYLALLPAMGDELGGWNQPNGINVPQPPVSMDKANFYGGPSWKSNVLQSLQRHFEDGSRQRLPRVTTGAIAASDALMKDATLLDQWRQSARQLLAVEMELTGVYTAARTKNREYPIAAVRGISDIVGFKRHPDWTEYACQTAASFAHALISTKPFEPVVKSSINLISNVDGT